MLKMEKIYLKKLGLPHEVMSFDAFPALSPRASKTTSMLYGAIQSVIEDFI